MRFAMVRQGGRDGIAVVDSDDQLHALFSKDPAYPGTLDQLVVAGMDALRAADDVLRAAPGIDPDRVEFLPPLVQSRKIICVGLNYLAHSMETGNRPPPPHPTVFARFATGLIGHGAPLICPTMSVQLDYEVELVAVIGQGGRDIAKSDALKHVIGYSVFNDGSVRDVQLRTPQWTVGKNFDGTGPFGPYFVTADELPPGGKGLKMQTRLNGVVMQEGNTQEMVFDIETLISELSETFTWEPGDIIVSGTPGGVGMARKPPVWMKPGDVCEVEIERVGLLRNPIVAQQARAG